MENIGETLVGDYLKVILGCDFVAFNTHTQDVQGEIDVVGINTKKNEVYICEVAVHLTTGLMYVKQGEKLSVNVERLVKKFEKDIAYARKYLANFTHKFMLWTPILRVSGEDTKNNQTKDIAEIKRQILEKHGIEIIVICNHDFQKSLDELRNYAAKESKELKSPVLRYLQIEEKLKKHLVNLDKKSAKSDQQS